MRSLQKKSAGQIAGGERKAAVGMDAGSPAQIADERIVQSSVESQRSAKKRTRFHISVCLKKIIFDFQNRKIALPGRRSGARKENDLQESSSRQPKEII
jgi:hypothetical protein